MSQKITTVDLLRSGQAGPYKDSIWEAYIWEKVTGSLLRGTWYFSRFTKDVVKEYAKILIHEFADLPEWHQPRMEICTPAGPTQEMKKEFDEQHGEGWLTSQAYKTWAPKPECRWYVKIVQTYLD